MKRLSIFFIFITAQIIISLTAGYLALDAMAPPAAANAGHSRHMIDNGFARYAYGDTEFLFRVSDVGLVGDHSNVDAPAVDKSTPAYRSSLLTAFMRDYGHTPRPFYYADALSFRQKLIGMKQYIDVPPVDADIELTPDGDIVRTPSSDGVNFDVDGQLDNLYEGFLADPFARRALDAGTKPAPAVRPLEPRVPDSLLADVDAVLAEIEVDIPDGCNAELLAYAAEAVNKVWAPKKGMAYDSFSFLRYIGEAGLPADARRPEYDFAASALLHALLASGVDFSKITYVRSPDADLYPDLPGFGAALIDGGAETGKEGGEPADFRFYNTLNCNIVIFARADGGSLRVSIAGSSKLAGENAAPYDIHSVMENGRAQLYRDGKKVKS